MGAAGMAGEHLEQLTAYLSRLIGEPVAIDQPIKLRSVHRAALGSWARKQNIALRLTVISATVPFTVLDLIGETSTVASVAVPSSPVTAPVIDSVQGTVAGIGIDIEDVENLPVADDYREHPFFQDNFTSAELAYCLRQVNVRASLCGTWAAKEALLKSGRVVADSGFLKKIEITRDAVGRPTFPQCSLSISHTPKTAVAVCVVLSAATAGSLQSAPTEAAVSPAVGEPAVPSKGRWPWSRSK